MIQWAGIVLGGLKLLPGTMKAIERHRCARIAHDLATLRFWCDGMAAPLRHIVEGGCSQTDLDEIDTGLRRTKDEVTKVAQRLRKAREDFVATRLGMSVASALDVVIYEKLAPGSIRPQLERMVEVKDCSISLATELLNKITLFNEHLDKVHEAIRPKPQSLTPSAGRTKTSSTKRTA